MGRHAQVSPSLTQLAQLNFSSLNSNGLTFIFGSLHMLVVLMELCSCRISDYVKYVEGLEAVEDSEHNCIEHRLLLEKAWQIVANEFYDSKGRFSQAAWASQLLHTLQARSTAQSWHLVSPGKEPLCRACEWLVEFHDSRTRTVHYCCITSCAPADCLRPHHLNCCSQDAGGCLHSRPQTYKALRSMVASLGDRYTEFLVPSKVRQLLQYCLQVLHS